MFVVFSYTINNHEILASFGFNQESNFISFLIFLKLYELISWVTSLISVNLSRHFEYQADFFASDEYREALGRGLIKIHVKNASNLNPDSFFAALYFSHPTLIERLAALGNPEI
jgi:STE24 endopeptidase